MRAPAWLASAVLLGACAADEAPAHRWLDLALGSDALVIPADDPAAEEPSHDEAQFSWSVDQDAGEIDDESAVFVAESRSYWMSVGSDQLATGVDLVTTAPGAQVMVRPISGDARASSALPPAALTVLDPRGAAHEGGEGMTMLAGWEELADARVALPEGTAMFAIDAALGAGTFALVTGERVRADAYLVSVREPDSEAVLRLGTERDAYVYGETVRIEAALAWGDAALTLEGQRDLDARVRGPAGEGFAVVLRPTASPGHFAGTVLLDSDTPSRGALWDVEVCAIASSTLGDAVRRCAHTGFAYAVPTARLTEAAVSEGESDGVQAEVGVEVAAAGRYALSGMVFGTDAHGVKQPLAMLQVARWLQPGHDTLTLALRESITGSSDLAAPWSLEDLRLVDQGRLGLLQRHTVPIALAP